MILARVSGTIVASCRNDSMDSPIYLLVTPCGTDGTAAGTAMVALDSMNASLGEVVLVSQGSSTRQLPQTIDKPVDALIVGIVDAVSEDGKDLFRK